MINRALFSSSSCEWATPQEVFDNLNDEFHFTLDPCALPPNAKCAKYYTPNEDGLIQDWGGRQYSATLPMADNLDRGCANAERRAGNLTPR